MGCSTVKVMRVLIGTGFGAAAALAVLLTGCGVDAQVPDSKPAGRTLPCSEVWSVGKSLPKDYEGCTQTDGTTEAAVSIKCEKGGRLVTFDDKFWVVTPGQIRESRGDIAADDDYLAALTACTRKRDGSSYAS